MVFLNILTTLSLLCTASAISRDSNSECHIWAEQDGECINNPRYMWGACHASCVKAARDDDERCGSWALEGECTNNPGYVPIHCPESCGFSISWNPWYREQQLVDPLDQGDGDLTESCLYPTDVFSAAEIMRERLNKFIVDGNHYVKGFNINNSGDFNGVVSLSEAILYTLRLYFLIIKSHGLVLPAHEFDESVEIDEHGNVVLDIMVEPVGSHSIFFRDIMKAMTPPASWSADEMRRSVYFWTKRLNELSEIITSKLFIDQRMGHSGVNCDTLSDGPDLVAIKENFGPSRPNSMGLVEIDQKTNSLSSLTLSNGISLPVIGLGTWNMAAEECESSVYEAIKIGYRHIDGAEAYGNDVYIGNAIRKAILEGIVKREELFIANKISNEENMGFDNTKRLVYQQLHDCGLEYFDLYMIHAPNQNKAIEEDTWRALEHLYTEGTLKAIGLSNYGAADLSTLLGFPSLTIRPMVVQNKLDVYHVGKQIDPHGDQIMALLIANDIRMVAYSPLSAFPFIAQPADDPIVRFVAAKHRLDPSQVVLRWIMQQGIAVIPRSTSLGHLRSNFNSVRKVNELSSDDMDLVSSIAYLVESPLSRTAVYY